MNPTLKELLTKTDVLKFVTVTTMLTAFILCIVTLLFKRIPSDNKDAIMLLIGMITGSVKTMIDYHYGSSKSSQKKSDTIDSMIKTKEDANNN